MLQIHEITSKEEWDGFIKANSWQPLFFQGWTWGELERLRGKQVYFLGFKGNGNGNGLVPGIDTVTDASLVPEEGANSLQLQAIALAVLVKARRGTFLHVRGGPLSTWNNPDLAANITSSLINFAKDLKCDFIRISPNILKAETVKVDSLLNLGFRYCQMHDVDAEITWVLDLTQTEADILAGMRKQTRYLVRKAQATPGLKIVITKDITDPKYMDAFWNIYQDTVKRQKWHAYNRKYLEDEFKKYAANDEAQMLLAEYEGKFIAASMFIYYEGQVFYHHSGSLSEYRKIPAMYLLHWESIKEGQRRGCNKYNFFGIARDDDPKHPWAGLSLFKKGFGGEQIEMVHALDYPLTRKYWLTHYYEKVEKTLRGY